MMDQATLLQTRLTLRAWRVPSFAAWACAACADRGERAAQG